MCEKDPDYVEWDPSLSTCKLPKRANKENESGGGKWHCKAQLINPSERSVEAEQALAAEVGYELVTEKSTIAGLVSEDFMRRWKSSKGKEPFVICKLKCHDGYELEGKFPSFALFPSFPCFSQFFPNFLIFPSFPYFS